MDPKAAIEVCEALAGEFPGIGEYGFRKELTLSACLKPWLETCRAALEKRTACSAVPDGEGSYICVGCSFRTDRRTDYCENCGQKLSDWKGCAGNEETE